MLLDFCATHSLDHWFPEGHDVVPYLQVFAVQYLDGCIAHSQRPVRSDTVEQNIGQSYAQMVTSDPRLNPQGKLDLWLQQLFFACPKQEPPAQQVKLIQLSVVTKLLTYFDKEPNANKGNLLGPNNTAVYHSAESQQTSQQRSFNRKGRYYF